MARRKDPVIAYATRVAQGRIVAGPHVRNACRRHLNDHEHAHKRGLYWDIEAAFDAINFFPDVLRLAGGQFEGRPFRLDPSQEFIIGSIFGWKRADGTRRFRRAYIEEGKGNGKSPLAAGIGLYCMIADREKRAEIYAAASKKDQALVMFRDAVAMYQQSPALQQVLTASGANPIYNLSDLRTGSFFRPIASAQRLQDGGVSAGQSGPRPSCALCDEVHEHRDGTVIEMLERGFKWRLQPLLVMITNSGSDRNSVCYQEHTFAVKAAAEELEYEKIDSAFSYVCALDEGDDPLTDARCWVKANPLLGRPEDGKILTREYLADVVAQAVAIPGKLNNILRLHFCVWTDAEQNWMTRDALEAVLVQVDPEADGMAVTQQFAAQHEGKAAAVGIDLSSTLDLTAVAFVVRTGEVEVERANPDGSTSIVTAPTFDGWIEAWTPGDTLAARSVRDSAPYDFWARHNWLRAPPGRLVRFDYPAAHLAEIASRLEISAVAYDRYAFRRFEEELDALGLDLPLVEHPQGGKRRGAAPDGAKEGLWMPGSVMELERLILERRIRLLGNPVLISACMSAVFEGDPFGNRWLSKRRATGRIDALVALAMAVGAALLDNGGPEYSMFFLGAA